MTEETARRLEIFRMVLEIRCRREMPELMRRHVNADMPQDSLGDLYRESCLGLAAAARRDEGRAIHVGAEARQYVPAIPSQAAGNIVRDLTDNVFPLGLGVA